MNYRDYAALQPGDYIIHKQTTEAYVVTGKKTEVKRIICLDKDGVKHEYKYDRARVYYGTPKEFEN